MPRYWDDEGGITDAEYYELALLKVGELTVALKQARREALREAEKIALDSKTVPSLTHPDGSDYGADSRSLLIAGRIRALAEGDSNE